MNGAGVLAVAANQDQSGGQFLLLRPVIMHGVLDCGHIALSLISCIAICYTCGIRMVIFIFIIN